LGGIAGILDDVYRTRPRTLDLYGRYYDTQDKGESQRKGTTLKFGIDPLDISSLSSSYGPRTTETLIEAIFNPVPSHSEKQSPFTYHVPLEQQGKRPSILSSGYNTSTNGSSSLKKGANGSVHSTSTGSEYASVYSDSTSGKPPSLSSQSARSVSSHGNSSEFGVGGGGEDRHKSWWRKIGHSRPGTPAK